MEGNNYGFKFDSNKIEKSFDNGSKLSIENDGGELNMSPEVVSPGNKGFASVIGLAALIAVAGVIIAFITLKY